MKEKSGQLLQVELAIAYLLRYGVLLCGAVLAVGLGMLLVQAAAHPTEASFLQQAQHDAAAASSHVPRTWEQMRGALSEGDANAIIAIGLILLIALPILRVGATVVVFFVDKDPLYFAITLFVFVVLVSGIVLGKAL